MSESPHPVLALLEFERRIQAATSNREVSFRAVNDGSQVLRFDQALLWRRDVLGRPMVAVASGLAEITVDSPYQQWIVQLILGITPDAFEKLQDLSLQDLPEAVVEDGEEWCSEHLLHCPLIGPDGVLLGGMLFFRNEPFSDSEKAAAEWIGRSTAYGLWAWRTDRHSMRRWVKSSVTKKILGYGAAIVLLSAFIPV